MPPPAHPYFGHIARGDWVTIRQRTLESPMMRAVRTFGPSHLTDGLGVACAGGIRLQAPECELTSLRVLGAESSCTGETLLTGPGWAVDQGFDIVNVSLSTTKTDLRDALSDLADRAYFGGTVLVAATGNRRIELPVAVLLGPLGRQPRPARPASCPLQPQPPVDFFACGTNVPARRTCGDNSFAAAYVVGVGALLLWRRTWLSSEEGKSAAPPVTCVRPSPLPIC